MTLLGPTDQDERKLHSEVNQLVNQRFVLTTLAVTLFGVITAWAIPRERPPVGETIGSFRFAVSMLLHGLLFMLFLFAHHLSGMIRVISTYFVVTQKSGWERDWSTFRKEPYLGYTKTQAIIFVVLGILSTAVPFWLWAAFDLAVEPKAGALAVLTTGAIYLVFVCGMSFLHWFDPEKGARQRWEEISQYESDNTNATDVKREFFDLGFQYYVAGRFGAFAWLNPVCATLFHHAVECFLKGYLAGTGWTLRRLNTELKHNLPKIWKEFKAEVGDTTLDRLNKIVHELHKFEQIRYPDAMLGNGLMSAVTLANPMAPVSASKGTQPIYQLVVEDIDALVGELFQKASTNPSFFRSKLSTDGQTYLSRDNKAGF